MAFATIDKGSKYFNTVTYSGNSTDGRSLTGVGFKPDLVWIKIRSTTGGSTLQDIVRGANKFLSSNSTNAETTDYSLGYLSSFTSDGFVLEQGSDPTDGFLVNNATGQTYVSWNFLASNTTASNTNGTITSTVSANTTSGFSIVSYTGTGSAATIGHGLGSTPKMIITKKRSSTSNWAVYHASLLASQDIRLNLTDAVRTSNGSWNGTRPTSTVFSVQDDDATNLNGATYIGYCFAEVKGFSKAFSYTGNGSTDGSFVYCGFLPSFVLLKRTDSAGFNWVIHDNKRDINNPDSAYLHPNTSGSESTDRDIDLLSNGFKMRNSNTTWNASGGTYIGIAFASNPFVSSKGIPTCAF